MNQFVLCLSRVLPKNTTIESILNDVQELFAQIDVDGSSRIDWGEFSAFCIEVGMAASTFGKNKRLPNTYFEQRYNYSDITLHADGIRRPTLHVHHAVGPAKVGRPRKSGGPVRDEAGEV